MFNELVQPDLLQIISLNRAEQTQCGNSMSEHSVERAVGHARYDGTVQPFEGASAKTHIVAKACSEAKACLFKCAKSKNIL